MAEIKISPDTEWKPGETYALSFDVKPRIFGSSDASIRKATDDTLNAIRADSRLQVLRYTYSDGLLTVTVLAREPSSPILIIIGAVIALGVVYGVYLTFREVRRVVAGPVAGEEAKTGTFAIGRNAMLIGLGLLAAGFALPRIRGAFK